MRTRYVYEFTKIGEKLGWTITGGDNFAELLIYVESVNLYMSIGVLDNFGKQDILNAIKDEMEICDNEEFKAYLNELYKVSQKQIRKKYREVKRKVEIVPEFPFY